MNDPCWSKTADFVLAHIDNGGKILAPIEFEEIFPGRLYPYLMKFSVWDLLSMRLDIRWIIVHKGMMEEIGYEALKVTLDNYRPVFANEVFVVFTNQPGLSEVDSRSPHFNSFKNGMLLLDHAASGRKGHRKEKGTVPNNNHGSNINWEPKVIYLGDHQALTKTIWGHKIIADTQDISLAPHILLDGYWEKWISEVLQELITEGNTVVEVGANIGYYTLLAASRVGPGGRIVAFEANPRVFEILYRNMAINGFLDRVQLVNQAVFSETGKLNFHVFEHYQGSSSVIEFPEESVRDLHDEIRTIEVDATSLEDFFTGEERQIDLIKIDAEGSECRIFKGMTGVIEANPGIVIVCEFSPALIRAIGDDPEEFLDMIASWGFMLKYISPTSKLIHASIEELLAMPQSELFLSR